MRKIIVCNIVSLDGYFADPEGRPPFAGMDEFFDAYNLERITAADTVLLGRTSYQGFGDYWPHIADAPDDPADRSLDGVNRGISRRWNEVPKVVVTDNYRMPGGHPWQDTTTAVPRDAVAAWIAAARESGDGEIVIFGSRVLWNALLAQGLVDELHLMIAPVTFGGGTPAFPSPATFTLAGTRTRPGSANTLLVYTPPSP